MMGTGGTATSALTVIALLLGAHRTVIVASVTEKYADERFIRALLSMYLGTKVSQKAQFFGNRYC